MWASITSTITVDSVSGTAHASYPAANPTSRCGTRDGTPSRSGPIDVIALFQADVVGNVEVRVAIRRLRDPVSRQVALNRLPHVIRPDSLLANGSREMRCCCLN